MHTLNTAYYPCVDLGMAQPFALDTGVVTTNKGGQYEPPLAPGNIVPHLLRDTELIEKYYHVVG